MKTGASHFLPVQLQNFHGIFGIFEISNLTAYIVSLFVFLVITNSLNLIDGIDGLAGLISLKFFIAISFILYFTDGSLYSFAVNKESMLAYSLTLIGALIGFLIFNYKSYKKVFLGDFGSLLIGSIITYFIFRFQLLPNASIFVLPTGIRAACSS